MELSRRTFNGLVLGGLLAACGASTDDLEVGSDVTSTTTPGPPEPTPISLPMRDVSAGDPRIAGEAISQVAEALFAATRAGAGDSNHTISPASIAIALAMLELGTSGAATDELRALFGIDDANAEAFHQSMGALEVDLEQQRENLTFRLANAAYIQDGFPFEQPFLNALGTSYGAALVASDFIADAERERAAINAWVEEQTEGFIVDLLAPGAVHRDTVLVLVNALYLLATWESEFDPDLTETRAFVRLDGSEVDVDMMLGTVDASWEGEGYVAGEKRYDGGLVAQFVVPDDGQFDEIADSLSGVFDRRPEFTPGGASLVMPRFETRSDADLIPALQANDISAIFVPGGLLGIAEVGDLVVDGVIHQTYVSFDEKGTEAAAATAITIRTTSAGPPEIPVILDRPFLYRIVDSETNATVFVGQVLDPTAG